jgi:sugar lactone lactonase YvrE
MVELGSTERSLRFMACSCDVNRMLLLIHASILTCLLSACGGGSDNSPPPPQMPQTFAVAGTVSGLSSGESLVLQENGGNNTTVSANGSFALPAALASGATYTVTVITPPAGKRCFVENGGGVIASANVTNVNISCGSPQLALLAGAIGGPGNADGPAAVARFDLRFAATDSFYLARYWNAFGQGGVAVDSQGNVFVADAGNNTVRRIDTSGVVTTVAGKAGAAGSTDGAAKDARFRGPTGVAIDHVGNLYIADTGNNVIREISAGGIVSTFAGSVGVRGSADGMGAAARFTLALETLPTDALGPWPTCRGAIAVDGGDNVYVADCGNSTIRKITPAGGVSTLAGTAGVVGSSDGTAAAARLAAPLGLAVDAAGNVYVADALAYPTAVSGNTIRMITPGGVVTTIAGTPGAIGSTDGAGSAARFNVPSGVAVDGFGNVYVADNYNNMIRKIAPGGVVTTLAGTDAQFNSPSSLACDGAGNVYVVDAGNNTIRTINPAGVVATLAGTPVVTGFADGVDAAARFNLPNGIATDGAGDIFVADTGNHTIRKVAPSGSVSTFAGAAGQHGSSDGSAATFFNPSGVAVDSSGNVYVADSFNQTIRKITAAGVVSTLAGNPLFNAPGGSSGPSLGGSDDGTGSSATFRLALIPYPSPTELYLPICHGGVATDSSGNVFVADCGNDTIRKITPAGVVTTFAGTAGMPDSTDGSGAAARFKNPTGVATDAAANVYVADSGNNVIRKITPTGVVTTLAGTAGVTGSNDGSGTAASFNDPESVTTDDFGNVYVADTGNSTIRKITPDGSVTTVLGTAGVTGFSAGDLPGVLASPVGVVFKAGAVYVTTENGVAVGKYIP